MKQQQHLQETLDSLKTDGRPQWDQHAKSFYREPRKGSFGDGNTIFSEEWRNIPPPPTVPIPPIPQDNINGYQKNGRSVRGLPPNGVAEVAKGFEVKESPDVAVPAIPTPKRTNYGSDYTITQGNNDLEDYTVRSILHSRGNESYLTYGNTRWKIYLKKEVFYPNEIMNATLKHLIYRQILEDLGSRTCCRLSGEDRYKMQRLLDTYTSSTSLDTVASTLANKTNLIVNAAKDLPLYFSRIYNVDVSTFLVQNNNIIFFYLFLALLDYVKVTQ